MDQPHSGRVDPQSVAASVEKQYSALWVKVKKNEEENAKKTEQDKKSNDELNSDIAKTKPADLIKELVTNIAKDVVAKAGNVISNTADSEQNKDKEQINKKDKLATACHFLPGKVYGDTMLC